MLVRELDPKPEAVTTPNELNISARCCRDQDG
jgi:hypothetical protein